MLKSVIESLSENHHFNQHSHNLSHCEIPFVIKPGKTAEPSPTIDIDLPAVVARPSPPSASTSEGLVDAVSLLQGLAVRESLGYEEG